MLRKKIARFLPIFIIIIYGIVMLVNYSIDTEDNIHLPLNTITDSTNIVEGGRTLEHYENIQVNSTMAKEIIINKPNLLIKVFAPHELYFMDGLRLLFFSIGGIVFIITFWNFSYERPFTKQTTLGMLLTTILFYLFISAQIWRNYFFNNYLFKHTGQNFNIAFPNIFFNIEFWLGAIFLSITKVFKKGTKLQQEQDLTV